MPHHGARCLYQASGAFGFRDQLQDSLSLLLLKPQLAHEQLLNAAAHQFLEGMCNIGGCLIQMPVFAHISDDIVWLAYATAFMSIPLAMMLFLIRSFLLLKAMFSKVGNRMLILNPLNPQRLQQFMNIVL